MANNGVTFALGLAQKAGKLAAMLLEDAADTGSHGDGVARYLEIEVIRKQRVKLDA